MPTMRWSAAACLAAALPFASRAADDPPQAPPEQKAPAGEASQKGPAGEAQQIPEIQVEEMVIVAPARLEPSVPRSGDASVTVLDSKEIAAAHARTVQDLLQQLPASSLSDEQGNPFQQDLMIRGFVASPVTGLPQGLSVFVDGVRINEPSVEEVNFDLVPLEDVERIEVIHGADVVFGRNTLGGAINIVTKRGGTKVEAEASVEAGSWKYQQVRARASGPLGPLDGYLSVTELTESGWRAVGSSRGIRAFGKVGFRREDTDVTLSYQFQDDRLEQAGSIPSSFLAVDRRQNYTGGDFFQPTLHLVTLNGTQRLSPGLSLSANGFFRGLNPEQFNASFVSANTRLFNSTWSGGGTLQIDYSASLGAFRTGPRPAGS
jgi:outer membrane cobalamin receptor